MDADSKVLNTRFPDRREPRPHVLLDLRSGNEAGWNGSWVGAERLRDRPESGRLSRRERLIRTQLVLGGDGPVRDLCCRRGMGKQVQVRIRSQLEFVARLKDDYVVLRWGATGGRQPATGPTCTPIP